MLSSSPSDALLPTVMPLSLGKTILIELHFFHPPPSPPETLPTVLTDPSLYVPVLTAVNLMEASNLLTTHVSHYSSGPHVLFPFLCCLPGI